MKIVAPHISATPPHMLPERLGENADRGAEGFADLLAAILSTGRGLAHNQAADLTPRIGSDGKAFEHARLLVETALDLRGFGQPPGGHRARDLLQEALRAPAATARGAAAPARPTLSEHLGDWFARVAPASVGAGSVASLPAAATVTRAPARPEVPAAGAQPFRAAAQSVAPIGNGPVSKGDRRDHATPLRTARPVSPFGAQLFALEGGLRLVLRLPRLAPGERAELEASVAALFERFGHRAHDIVIHEIARGS